MTEDEGAREWCKLVKRGRISLMEMYDINKKLISNSPTPPAWWLEMNGAMKKLYDKHDKAVLIVTQEAEGGQIIRNRFDVHVPSPYPMYRDSNE